MAPGAGCSRSRPSQADSLLVTSRASTRTRQAHGRMINSIKIAADFIQRLPKDRLSPETTRGREGFVHPYVMNASVGRRRSSSSSATSSPGPRGEGTFPRDAGPRDRRGMPGPWSRQGRGVYRNMKEVLDRCPQVVDTVASHPARGLDCARPRPRRDRAGFSGLGASWPATPNIFAGEQLPLRLEWVSPRTWRRRSK